MADANIHEDFSPEEMEQRKQYMYEKMSKRRRKFVDRLGYENWDPFTQLFVRKTGNNTNQEYLDAVSEFNVMLVMNFEKVRPVFEYCLWYAEHLKKHGVKP